MHYNFHSILLVGEGDFSFSTALARAFGSTKNIIATSLDTQEQVISSYNFSQNNLQSLEQHRAMKLHNVDTKTMKKHEILKEMLFNRIVYNFPHVGFFAKGKDRKSYVSKIHSTKDVILSKLGFGGQTNQEPNVIGETKLDDQIHRKVKK